MMPLHTPLIDSTLREGEQFATAYFTLDDKLAISDGLDALGVGLIEVTSPAASPQAFRDARALAARGLRARVVAHVRCRLDDVARAIDAGVSGVGLYFATSPILRRAGHGRSIDEICEALSGPIALARSAGLEVRFSAEDTFRSDWREVERVLDAAVRAGAHRLGLADTVGVATPRQVRAWFLRARRRFGMPLGFHGHNDSASAVANAWEALEAGAGYVDVTLLGIGERVGITPLGALVARALSLGTPWAANLDLRPLQELELRVARAAGIEVPFDSPLTSPFAFAHKAGPHVKAALADPSAYEVVSAERAGGARRFVVAARVTGRHAVAHRAAAMGLTLSEKALAEATARVKALDALGPPNEGRVEDAIRATVQTPKDDD